MAVDVRTEIRIGRPRAVVSAFAADPMNAPKWYKNIRSAAWKSDPVLTQGARVAFVAHFLGRRLEYTYVIAEHVPGERLVMRTAEGPFPMETTYAWSSSGEATVMKLRNRGEPSGFSRLLAPFMAMAMRSANEKDLALLKKVLESGDSVH